VSILGVSTTSPRTLSQKYIL